MRWDEDKPLPPPGPAPSDPSHRHVPKYVHNMKI